MNELLDLEPRETDADELDVDTVFARIADPAAERGPCPNCCDAETGDWLSATGAPW